MRHLVTALGLGLFLVAGASDASAQHRRDHTPGWQDQRGILVQTEEAIELAVCAAVEGAEARCYAHKAWDEYHSHPHCPDRLRRAQRADARASQLETVANRRIQQAQKLAHRAIRATQRELNDALACSDRRAIRRARKRVRIAEDLECRANAAPYEAIADVQRRCGCGVVTIQPVYPVPNHPRPRPYNPPVYRPVPVYPTPGGSCGFGR